MVSVNAGPIPMRRKSIGIDLYALPTHLHVTDRLVDLHAQSKIVTVIKTTNTNQINEIEVIPPQPKLAIKGENLSPRSNPNDSKLIEYLEQQVSSLSKQLDI
jgi:hypothetical protein